jgi:segregation and condensation protein B
MSNTLNSRRINLLEAALYSAGRPVNFENLKRVVKTKSNKVVTKLIKELSNHYDKRESALEVKSLPGKRAVMRLKTKYKNLVKRHTNKPLLSSGPLKTLSFIAYNQPVEQIKVINDRGSHAYSHIKMMKDMGLIRRRKLKSRSYIIETTDYFSDYFGFGYDPIKSRIQLRQVFNALKIHKLDNGNGDESMIIDMLSLPLEEGGFSDIEVGLNKVNNVKPTTVEILEPQLGER